MSIIEQFVRYVSYPLWDLKDRSDRLTEYRRLMQSQWLAPRELTDLQLRRLNAQVAHCARTVPFYRHSWGGSAPQLGSLEELQALPLVTKHDVRDFQEDLVSSAYPSGTLIEAKTGGSTGTALRLLFDRRCQEHRNAAAMRSDVVAGWMPGMLVGALWGSPPIPQTIKEKLRNALHDRIFFLDTMDLNEVSMTKFMRSLAARRAGTLFGHSHSLYVFAKFVLDHGLPPPRLSAIVSTSMMLLENERLIIEQAFGCPVTNRYGCEEVGLIASECERRSGLHINAEHVIVEVVGPDGSWVAPGEEGTVVVTDLVNRGMPLVRYCVEDVAVASARTCPCERGAPLLERIVGRVADFMLRRDGSRVAGVSLVEKTLTAIAGIEQLQIVQHDYEDLELNIVAEAHFRPALEKQVAQVLREVFGKETRLRFNYLQALPQERNSKYRFAVCRVPNAS